VHAPQVVLREQVGERLLLGRLLLSVAAAFPVETGKGPVVSLLRRRQLQALTDQRVEWYAGGEITCTGSGQMRCVEKDRIA
jgi:hypothetical protein